MVSSHTYKLTAYPKEVHLPDGTSVVLKPLTAGDGEALLQFFLKVPAEDRRFLKEDVTSPKVVKRWVTEPDYDRALPILAWSDDKVVADATLHRTRTLARRHVGEIRILVAPEYRSRGLGTILMRELATIANDHGLERLVIQAVAEREEAAIKAAESIGFTKVAVLPGHAKDVDGHPRDIVLMDMPLGKWFDWWSF